MLICTTLVKRKPQDVYYTPNAIYWRLKDSNNNANSKTMAPNKLRVGILSVRIINYAYTVLPESH